MPTKDANAKEQTWLILPTLNEAENLAWLLPLLTPSYQVVVVDNGSNDGSDHIAESLGAYYNHTKPKGYGRAVLEGLTFVATLSDCLEDKVIIFDADGTSPVSALPEIIESLDTHDFVIGQRTSIERGAMPLHAKIGNRAVVSAINILTSFHYTDLGPLRGMRLKHFRKIHLEDLTWGINVEWQIKAQFCHLTTKQIDICYETRKYGQSKISGSILGSIKAASKMLWAVIFYGIVHSKHLETTAGNNSNNTQSSDP